MTIILVVVSISVLIFVHEFGHFLFAKIFKMPVEEFCIGFPPRLWKKQIGETTYSIGALPFGGFVKITGENGEETDTTSITNPTATTFSTHPFYQKFLVILAGICFNILAGWIALTFLFITGIPKHLLITNVAPNSPAEASELKSGDIIVRAGKFNDPIPTESFIEFTNENKGGTITLEILRKKQTISVETAIRAEVPEGEGSLGVELVEIGLDSDPFPKNIIMGGKATWKNLTLITESFFELITGVFTHPEIASGVTGPIGIIGIATQAGNLGLPYLIELMAIISLNLAILNLIPFPALDGGRLLFLVVEKIIRRPLSFKAQAIANTAGFAVLILLMVIVTIRDISGLAK